MSLRTRLMLLFTLTIALCVGLVTVAATLLMRRAFEAADAQHTAALVAQFQQEFQRRGEQVSAIIESIANREATAPIAMEAAHPEPDYSAFVDEARTLADSHQLDFLQFLTQDGTIISSAQWPARFGYKETWITQNIDWKRQGAFLKREELPDGPALGLIAVRPVQVGEAKLYVVGGLRLDRSFLKSLVLPSGIRAMLYTNTAPGFSPQSLQDVAGPVANAEKLGPFIQSVQLQPRQASEVVSLSPTDPEAIKAIPLEGLNHDLLGILLVASSRHDLLQLESRVRMIALIVGGIGIIIGLIMAAGAAARVTKPVEQLAVAASEVTAGNWNTQVEVTTGGEVRQLAKAFNHMTRELIDQRERLIQSERVAAWRELARRLAHELKNPLFPMQITVENLLRSREASPDQFDEVFRESTTTLLAELSNLKAIIGRFSDFAKMPAPQLSAVSVNELVQRVVRLYESQLKGEGKPAIATRLELGDVPFIQADPDLLHRAVSNLVLNAVDAMPQGGTLTVRTESRDGNVRIVVSDSGTGLTREECERLFTPYYTTKQHGTGLGLAIVQSVISDHHGKISVESEPGEGTSFRIDLPVEPAIETARGANVE